MSNRDGKQVAKSRQQRRDNAHVPAGQSESLTVGDNAHASRKWLTKFGEPLSIGTLFLFFATVGLAWYTRELVSGGREASERNQRPYLSVFVHSATGKPLPDGGFRVEVVPDFRVFGKTPAGNVAPGWELKVADYPFSDKFTYTLQAHTVSTAVAAPEERYAMEAKVIDLSKEEVAAITAG